VGKGITFPKDLALLVSSSNEEIMSVNATTCVGVPRPASWDDRDFSIASTAQHAVAPPTRAGNNIDPYQTFWTLVAYEPAIHVWPRSIGAKVVPVVRVINQL
jgi:hypothetical protein